jgi:hypothetical protein
MKSHVHLIRKACVFVSLFAFALCVFFCSPIDTQAATKVDSYEIDFPYSVKLSSLSYNGSYYFRNLYFGGMSGDVSITSLNKNVTDTERTSSYCAFRYKTSYATLAGYMFVAVPAYTFRSDCFSVGSSYTFDLSWSGAPANLSPVVSGSVGNYSERVFISSVGLYGSTSGVLSSIDYERSSNFVTAVPDGTTSVVYDCSVTEDISIYVTFGFYYYVGGTWASSSYADIYYNWSDLHFRCDVTSEAVRTEREILESIESGYDSSAGDSAADSFHSGSSDFGAAEDSLFSSSTEAMSGFTFFDVYSVPAVITGISFVSSVIAMLFDASGGLSGAGIVMSISLCVLIACIVIGIWRYWHSGGGS